MTRADVSRPAVAARTLFRCCIVAAALLPALAGTARGQTRADVVTLGNGDRITGEIIRLERGRLEFKTDDAGTLYLEWDKLTSLVASRLFEVVAADGRRFLGSLGAAPSRSIAIVNLNGKTALAMSDVTRILTIGRSFRAKIDGSIDAGFSFTRSSGVAQLNLNSTTVYRRPAFEARMAASLTATRTEGDSGRDDRGSLDLSYQRYPWRRWFIAAGGRFETNESLGIALRSQVAAAAGPRLINSNRAQLILGAGLVVNDERGVDVEPTQNVEALLVFRTSFYTYDRPTTTLDVGLQYYPSLSDAGRHRMQLDTSVKQELFKDLFVSLSLYNSYDSRPPNPMSSSNDIGVVASIGWTY